MKFVAADTGPLVALLNSRDQYHDWARDVLGEVEPPLLTCEAVIAESCFILRGVPGGPDAIMQLLERGVLKLHFELKREVASVRKLMTKYSNVPMSLADACLVRMAELDARVRVLSLDSDFRRYRKLGRQVIPLVGPSGGK